MKDLNIIFIGRLSFPLGIASTKRRRIIIDYLNDQKIKCQVICLRQKESESFNNSKRGFYGETEYISFSHLFYSGIVNRFKYFRRVKEQLKEFYKDGVSNFLIFHTHLEVDSIPFYLYAKKLGYKIIFDQVEINSVNDVSQTLKSRAYTYLNGLIKDWAMDHLLFQKDYTI
jgi:hypothetical protein